MYSNMHKSHLLGRISSTAFFFAYRCLEVNGACIEMLDSKHMTVNHAHGIAAWSCITPDSTFHLDAAKPHKKIK
jgi:hypothetical protein